MQNRILFNDDWKFFQDWSEEMACPEYDDSAWRVLSLPHDWSIEGSFSPDAVSYARGAYLPTGRGCYRKKFSVSDDIEGKIFKLYFEGVFKNSSVYLNGTLIGGREWGYIPFEADMTAFLRKDAENIIAVKVDNSEAMGCRWYAGSGIYRNVYFETYGEMCFVRNSIKIVTGTAEPSGTAVNITYSVKNFLKKRIECRVVHTIYERKSGRKVAESDTPHWIGATLEAEMSEKLVVKEPELWDIDNPCLYCLVSELHFEEKCMHRVENVFGFRTFEFNADTGFYLNHRPLKIKGCCLHNDGGSLGAAVGKDTFVRQIRILKTMGCNAVRTAHHPFSPDFLDVCDELGMLVLDECFDGWSEPQRVAPNSNGEHQFMKVHYYSHLFEKCSRQDLTDFIMRDRNHPSVFMWSVGNETPQMYKYSGGRIAGELAELVHNHDETRPVTCAVVVGKLKHDNISLLDVGGYNYLQIGQADDFHRLHPEQPMLGTECFSVQTRHPLGRYYADGKMKEALSDYYPVKYRIIEWLDNTVIGQENWDMAEDRPFIMGQFIWTGWDYLGEPTPYDYPAHTSFFGVIDTCGFPKDGYYYYRSAWTDEPTVHICSHWDYEEGDTVTLLVYSNCSSVELFINGKSHGRKYAGPGFQWTPDKSRTGDNFKGDTTRRMFMWTVPFEAGCVEASGIPAAGGIKSPVADIVYTSGAPESLSLRRCPFNEDSAKIIYMICEVFDKDGHRCLNAEPDILWTYDKTKLKLRSLDSGYQLSGEPFQGVEHRKCCAGRSIAIFERIAEGDCRVGITSPGLKDALCTVIQSDDTPYCAKKDFSGGKTAAPSAEKEQGMDVGILSLP